MNTEFDFFKTTMPRSRNADFYLGYFDGAVFMDFNRTHDNQITLSRISFDGYGCCQLASQTRNPLDSLDSQKLIKEFEKKELDQEMIGFLVKKIIDLNKEHIWIDALEEYQLIEKEDI